MKDYIIVYGSSPSLLEEQVNRKIEKGYIPIGGVSCNGQQSLAQDCMYQAMIKEN